MAITDIEHQKPGPLQEAEMAPASDAEGTAKVAAAIHGPDDSLIVDFDETLLLANSTTLFVQNARPRILALAWCAFLDALEPWRWLPGPNRRHVYRDWLRVVSLSVLLPWSLWLWRRQAPGLAARWANHPLAGVLGPDKVARPHVVTFGFRPVVAPLMERILPHATLTAGGFWRGYRLRKEGKRARLERDLGADAVAESVVVTDSEDDRDLLEASRRPLLICWPGMARAESGPKGYLPFHYTERGKRAGERYLLGHVILQDGLALCLAFAWLMPAPVIGALGLIAMHLGLWAIYELGYHENDRMAAEREAKGYVPDGAKGYDRPMSARGAWLTALMFSAAGLILVRTGQLGWPGEGAAGDVSAWFAGFAALGWMLPAWMAFLLLGRMFFKFYNHVTEDSRAILYPVLQLVRLGGYGLVAATGVVGAMLLAAFVIGRWMPYFVYRVTGQRRFKQYRLLVLSVFVVMMPFGLAVAPQGFLTWQFAVIAGWLLLRSHKEGRQFIRSIGFLQGRG